MPEWTWQPKTEIAPKPLTVIIFKLTAYSTENSNETMDLIAKGSK